MGKTRKKKDLVEKEFVSFPDIAVDIINALLYQGREIVEAGNLRAGPTEFIYQGGKELRNEYEDLCRYEVKDGRIKMMYLFTISCLAKRGCVCCEPERGGWKNAASKSGLYRRSL